MAASIQFDDGTPTTLTAAAGGRFNNWTPDSRPVDVASRSVGTGAVDTREHRENAKVSFEMLVLQSDLPVVERLIKHLWRGGVCTLNTDDETTPAPASFSNMAIGTEDGRRIRPGLVRIDPDLIDYLLTPTLQYIGAAPVPDLNVLY